MNPIQPPATGRPREISVTEAIEPAYERVKRMLFRPFNLSKWVTIGFGAWLASFGDAGGGGGFNGFNGGNFGNSSGNHNSHPAEEFRHFYFQARDYVLENIGWILPTALMVAVVIVVFWLVLLWLGSRGKFMFLHCVALDVAEVEQPWTKYARAADSLFRFRAVVGLVGAVLMLPLVVLIAVVILKMVLAGEANFAGVLLAVALGLGLFLLSLLFGLVHKFLMDFVVPVMYLRGGGCLAAWREFLCLLAANFWKFALYVLFQFVLNMAIGFIVMLVVLVTCCLAGCVMLLPFIGTVALLPVLVFQRAYPLYYLAQYGAQYDVFPAPPPPAVMAEKLAG